MEPLADAGGFLLLQANLARSLISITEANQNFSRVTKLVDEHETAVILKNNVPRYLVVDFSKAEKEKTANMEDVLAISGRLIRQRYLEYCLELPPAKAKQERKENLQ